MDTPNIDLIQLIAAPCFCVRDGIITARNAYAEHLIPEPGSSLSPLLKTGAQEYAAFRSGSLYLTLELGGTAFGASVERQGDTDYFLLEQEGWEQELTSLSLAARELRGALSGLCATADTLSQQGIPEAAQLNRNLAQLLRLVGNMSAAASPTFHPELLDICAWCREILTSAAHQLEKAQRNLRFQLPKDAIYTLADPQELERLLLNLLSNAAKFSAPGDTISCALTRKDRMLYLSVQDPGTGVPDALRGSLFRRYLRKPAIEDSRHGIGLGLVLVRAAAAHLGGTVLIDSPENVGTRVTVTLRIRQDIPASLHSPLFRVDYAGERDHCLLELSDILPAECYLEF